MTDVCFVTVSCSSCGVAGCMASALHPCRSSTTVSLHFDLIQSHSVQFVLLVKMHAVVVYMYIIFDLTYLC